MYIHLGIHIHMYMHLSLSMCASLYRDFIAGPRWRRVALAAVMILWGVVRDSREIVAANSYQLQTLAAPLTKIKNNNSKPCTRNVLIKSATVSYCVVATVSRKWKCCERHNQAQCINSRKLLFIYIWNMFDFLLVCFLQYFFVNMTFPRWFACNISIAACMRAMLSLLIGPNLW